MTIKPSLCPLDTTNKVPVTPIGENPHVHGPCQCLDQHDWAVTMVGQVRCKRCSRQRCAGRDASNRLQCDRATGHDKDRADPRHVFQHPKDLKERRKRR